MDGRSSRPASTFVTASQGAHARDQLHGQGYSLDKFVQERLRTRARRGIRVVDQLNLGRPRGGPSQNTF
jgi:hypothetical protein